jgi:hypothetical protein
MAMTKCKECGAEISTKADSCPQCGAKRKKNSGCALVLLGLLLLFIVAAIVAPDAQSPTSTAPSAANTSSDSAEPAGEPAESPADRETREMVWMERGKDAARSKLKDPDSAKFQNVYFHQGKDGVPLTCGEINSKNSFGGYGGFQKFISAGQADLTFLQEQMDASEFAKVWNEMCAG